MSPANGHKRHKRHNRHNRFNRRPPIPAKLIVTVSDPRINRILRPEVFILGPPTPDAALEEWQPHYIPQPPNNEVYVFVVALDRLTGSRAQEVWTEYFIGDPSRGNRSVSLRHSCDRDQDLIIRTPGTYRLTVSVSLDAAVPNFSDVEILGDLTFEVRQSLNESVLRPTVRDTSD